MNRRKVRRKRRRAVKSSSPALAAFVATLLFTMAVGCILLVLLSQGSGDGADLSVFEPGADVAMSSSGVLFAEKIFSENPDDINAAMNDLVINDSEGLQEAALEEGARAGDFASDTEGTESDEGSQNVQNNEEAVAGDSYWERRITSSNADYVTLAFAGDILFDPGYAIMARIQQNGGAIEGVVGSSLLNYMRNADIMVINNEFPYSDRGTPTEGKTFTFRALPSSASYLGAMGVDVATLANNHTYDFGENALLDTLSAIDNASVARVGAGSNIEEASHPIYYTAQNGIRIAIISATEIERLDNPDTKGATESSPGVFRCLDITRLQNRIREARDTGAFVIVCIHWGTENQEEIDWWQQKQGPEIVEAGADLIVGSHPHILQKIGYINGVPVVYSLGNYLFSSKTIDTGLLCVTVKGDHSSSLRFVPAVQSGCNVNEAIGDSGQAILSHLRQISPGVTIDADGNIFAN